MKWLFFIFLIGLVIAVGVGGFGYVTMKMHEEPAIKDAPWVIQTYSQDGMSIPSRVYYASEVEMVNGNPVIKNYWTYNGQTYNKQSGEKELPANSRIVRRRE